LSQILYRFQVIKLIIWFDVQDEFECINRQFDRLPFHGRLALIAVAMATIHCQMREAPAGVSLSDIPLSSLHISISEAHNMVKMWTEEFCVEELLVERSEFSRMVGELLRLGWLRSEAGKSGSEDDMLLIPASD